jgi:hypothetical protein
VRYVAPLFTTLEDFDRIYSTNEVLSESVFLRPTVFGPFTDVDRHCVSFTDRKTVHWLSEPRTVEERGDDETLLRGVMATLHERGDQALSVPALRDLLGQLAHITSRDLPEAGIRATPEELLRRISYLARVYLQAETLLVRPQA